MRKVISGQAAVEFRKAAFDQFGVLALNIQNGPINLADPTLASHVLIQFRFCNRTCLQPLATEQDAAQGEDVVAGLAIGAAALATGIGVDHAADGGAVGGGQFRREEQTVGLQGSIELVLHHAGLYPHPAFLDVDFEDAVHVSREIDHQTVCQGLAIGAGAPSARRKDDFSVPRFGGQSGDALNVFRVTRKQRRLWQALVDRVVGRQHGSVAMVGRNFSLETTAFQRLQEGAVEPCELYRCCDSGDHDFSGYLPGTLRKCPGPFRTIQVRWSGGLAVAPHGGACRLASAADLCCVPLQGARPVAGSLACPPA
ncbi:hypothetical protein D9M72_297620 [compost metagenome]